MQFATSVFPQRSLFDLSEDNISLTGKSHLLQSRIIKTVRPMRTENLLAPPLQSLAALCHSDSGAQRKILTVYAHPE